MKEVAPILSEEMSRVDYFKDLFDLAARFALYLTLAVIVLSIAIGVLLRYKKPDAMRAFRNVMIGFAIGYAVAIVGIMTYIKLYIVAIDDGFGATFWLVTGLFAVIIAGAIAAGIIALYSKKAFKIFTLSLAGVIVVYALVLCFTIEPEFMAVEKLSEKVLYYVLSGLMFAALVVLALISKKSGQASDTMSICYAAVCIAISFALSYIRFFDLPQGGSVTFASLLPLMVYAYIFGVRKGIFAGVIYGVLQFFQAPYFYEPMQFLLDYPLAFGFIGIAGCCKGLKIKSTVAKFMMGATLAVVLRYACHVLSGIFVFGSSDANFSAVAWSFLYNTFCFADLAIVLVAGFLLFASKNFNRAIANINPPLIRNNDEAAAN